MGRSGNHGEIRRISLDPDRYKKAAELYHSAVKLAHMSIQVENSRHYSKMSGAKFDISLVTDFCQSRAKEGNVYHNIFLACIMKMELE